MKYVGAGAVVAAAAAAGVYYTSTSPSAPAATTVISSETAAASVTAAPRELIVGGQFMTRLLDPHANVTGHDLLPLHHIYDTLVTIRPPNYNTYLPSLAKSWEISPDATMFTFHLRDDVKFYPSGNPMTADDVLWSMDRGIKGQFPGCKAYAYVKDIHKIDDYTVQVQTNTPFVPYLALITGLYDGAIMDSKAVIPHVTGAWGSPECDYGKSWVDEHSVGTGPYYLSEWSRGVRVVVERNPYYWGTSPANDKITFQIVAESAALQLLLEKGDVDIVHTGFPTDVINSYLTNPRPDVKVAQSPVFLDAVSHMNPGFAPFADANVRQAMRAAINYPEIIDKLLSGKGLPLSSPLYYGLLGGGKTYYEYDLEKAKSLMAQSKYPNGFEVTKIIPSAADLGFYYRDMAAIEVDNLAKIGIKVNVEEYDWSVMDERIIGVKYDWAQDYQSILFIDPEGILSLSGAPRHGTNVIINKDFPWRDEELDGILDQALAQPDPTKREQLYDQACKLMAERGVEIWYFQMDGLYPYRSNVKNFVPWEMIDFTLYSDVTK
jgi:ABC-type transport system substrate-binding protein